MAEKSLENRIKEADLAIKQEELARKKAETAKLVVEEKLIQKQVNAKWYAGKKLAAMATGVLTAVALYGVLDGIFFAPVRKQNQTVEQARERLANINARLLDARIDSLNRKQAKISTTIDSLRARVTISAVFGNLDSLKYPNALKLYKMIKTNNYFDRRLNSEGRGIENDFKVQDVNGDTVIYDAVTKLTWKGGSEFPTLTWREAKSYVETLAYAGGDWRLPTLQEAMSLMEPEKVEYDAYMGDSLYIDARFKDNGTIWTSDKYTASYNYTVESYRHVPTSVPWYVDFERGFCDDHVIFSIYVRAVR